MELPADDDMAARKVLEAALDEGIDFLDTADRYGEGRNEEALGRLIPDVGRDRFVIATKFGSIAAGADGKPAVDNSPAYIVRACEASLRRLRTDVIDLYYMHRRDPAVPVEDSVGAMSRLVEAGKVRALGLSEVAATTLVAANAVHPIAAVQSEYSLWHRRVADDVLPACRVTGTTIVPFSPLGRAFLTGKLATGTFGSNDLRSTLPRFQPYAMEANKRLVDALAFFAQARGASAAQVALAWLLNQNDGDISVVPIPGTKTPRYVSENAAAARLRLDDSEMAMLADLFGPGAVTGARYSEIEEARAGT